MLMQVNREFGILNVIFFSFYYEHFFHSWVISSNNRNVRQRINRHADAVVPRGDISRHRCDTTKNSVACP